MPSGVRHTQINLALALTGGAALAYAYSPAAGCVLAGSAILGDLFGSPDLDQECSDALRRWWYVRWIWRPYSHLRHRSPLSHGPILADAIRLVYLAAVLSVAWLVVGSFWQGPSRAVVNLFWAGDWIAGFLAAHSTLSLAAFGGLVLATTQHCVADWAVSEAKGAIKDWSPPKRKRK